jgi:asparagine synthase (glutamine-hydrolysing)
MCGISGILRLEIGASADESDIARMSDHIAHRGPDSAGYFAKGPIALGHRRLSVIDLHTGGQPITDPETGRVIVFNGEIYNYREIRKELAGRGVRFTTNSDTEVLLKLADFSNLTWLNRLNGMYGFAIWDRRLRKLLLARDRIGKKPIYYTVKSNTLYFASEVKALLSIRGVDPIFNSECLSEYLAFRHVLEPNTLFKDIFQLPSGHAMTWTVGNYSPLVEQHWSEDAFDSPQLCSSNLDTATEEFRQLFADAVSQRLVADVPLGSFNSGGVDSSLVTQQVRALSVGELHTFSVGFEEAQFDESAYADIVSKQLGTTHHRLVMSSTEYATLLPKAIYHLDEPLAHPHSVQIMALSQLAKRYVTVVLTGEGADELFAGYPRYQVPLMLDRLGGTSRALLRILTPTARRLGLRRLVKLFEVAGNPSQGIIENGRFCPLEDLVSILRHAPQYARRAALKDSIFSTNKSLLEKLLTYDRLTYMQSLLVRLDKMSMAAGLEARVPFLDYRLLLWSRQLPRQFKLQVFRENKRILKHLAAKTFPHEMIYRRKVGFGVPVAQWLRDDKALGQYLDLVPNSAFSDAVALRKSEVLRLRDAHVAGRADHSEALWGLVNLELWRRAFNVAAL